MSGLGCRDTFVSASTHAHKGQRSASRGHYYYFFWEGGVMGVGTAAAAGAVSGTW